MIERLKDKLGNRSNASGEIRLDGAWGRLVGEEGRGVATIIEMVVHTRLDCVLGSTALQREAVAQATHHCAHRAAFGKLLVDQPLMQNVLADLCVESEAATSARCGSRVRSTRATSSAASRRRCSSTGSASARPPSSARRSSVSAATASSRRAACRASTARARLNAIWEGSSNVQCLDVLRALRREPESAEAFVAELEERDRAGVERALASADEQGARRVVETMAVALQATLLDRHGDPAVAEAFRAREGFGAFGTLPDGLPLAEIVEQSTPHVSP